MEAYLVKTNIFKHFDYGDTIYPVNNGVQYAKPNALPGDNCVHIDTIKNNPDHFKRIDLGDNKELYNKFVEAYAKELVKKVLDDLKA